MSHLNHHQVLLGNKISLQQKQRQETMKVSHHSREAKHCRCDDRPPFDQHIVIAPLGASREPLECHEG